MSDTLYDFNHEYMVETEYINEHFYIHNAAPYVIRINIIQSPDKNNSFLWHENWTIWG